MTEQEPKSPERRGFLGAATTAAMSGGLLASYGTFFFYAGRFLYPADDPRLTWMFVTRVVDFPPGTSRDFTAPNGATIVITRRGEDRFLALSSTCPHLGCKVRWEGPKNRFFCPCHNGVFTPEGKGIEGPPEGMELLQYRLRVEDGLLYIEVPTERVADAGLSRPGHDRCLGGGAWDA
jgi:Rieske Fe-S protein